MNGTDGWISKPKLVREKRQRHNALSNIYIKFYKNLVKSYELQQFAILITQNTWAKKHRWRCPLIHGAH